MSDAPSQWGWAPYPVEPGEDHPGRFEVGDDGDAVDADSSARVVGLGAICGLSTQGSADDVRAQSFWVSEFARLADGRRKILHEERGFTVGSSRGAVQEHLTPGSITHDVLSVVLPDPDDGHDHPWAWLAQLAQLRGLDVTEDDLESLPYEVVLADSLLRWLGAP